MMAPTYFRSSGCMEYDRSMMTQTISGGVAHAMPKDLRSALLVTPKALQTWEDITPLARNEWICWTIDVKNPETRSKHVQRAADDLAKGKRRPCCWVGCTHRTDKLPSASQKWVLSRRAKQA